MTSADLSPEDRSLIDSLLGAWQEAVARGEEPRPETICPDRPDLWEAVVARAAQLASMAFLDGQHEDPVAPGDRLAGRYRLIEAIAAGGHADVWRARDERLLRDVAVKLISLGPLAVPGRLIDEGLRLASLSHPYIVRVFDAGLEGEIAFMVQELVTGDTLANRIAISPPAENEVLAWISQVAEALQAAHDHPAGIIHRDVKPTNILIDGHGKALLADFGIALPIGSAAVGTSVGTLPYKSPEQLDNQPLDRRSDVFSLGLVLYESLTGALPYSAFEPDTIRREMREPLAARIARLPAPRPLGPGLLPFLERALAVRPDARPRDAIAFRDELRRAAAGSGGFGRLRRLAIAATLVAIAITLAVTVAKAVIGERARRDQRIFEAENRRQMEDVQREIDRAMDVFKGAKSKLSEVRQLERQILEQTSQRDPSRQDRKAAAGEAVKPPPQRGDEPLHGPD
jgi:hypothetical protein